MFGICTSVVACLASACHEHRIRLLGHVRHVCMTTKVKELINTTKQEPDFSISVGAAIKPSIGLAVNTANGAAVDTANGPAVDTANGAAVDTLYLSYLSRSFVTISGYYLNRACKLDVE